VVVIGQNQEKVFALMSPVLLVAAGCVAVQWASLNHNPTTEKAPRMRPLQSLTLEAMIALLSTTFAHMPDSRQADRVTYSLHDTLMSGFAMMFFQHSSLLEFQRQMKQRRGRCNLETIFGVHEVPSDTQMREILDGVPPKLLQQLLPTLFKKVRRAGWATEFKSSVAGGSHQGDYYTAVLDGSDYFHSTTLQCPGCLQRTDGNSQVHFRHTVVSATLVKAGSHRVLPLEVEEVRNSDGQDKQDCELNAAKRLLARLRQEHPQLPLIIGGDDLYCHEPFIAQLRELRLHHVLVCKPGSHPELYREVAAQAALGALEQGTWHEGPACRRRFYTYRLAPSVPLTASHRLRGTFVEVWEHDRAGTLLYHNAWVTDLEVPADNVAALVRIGRSRWKIENEHFNVHKNHGYELEHNYGHGQQTLSMVFYLLNLLAFIAHVILERGDRLYQRCIATTSRRELWHTLRTAMRMILVTTWGDFLLIYLDEAGPSP
jgi:hypothetical protein